VIKRATILIVGMLCAWVVYEAPVNAYIDPGTGSYFIQMLVGGLLGAVFVFRQHLSRLTQFFRRKP